jgi:CubicO group peptidase (beta-lactamase class C family)
VYRSLPDLDAVLRRGLAWPVANVGFAVIDRNGDGHFCGVTDRVFALASVTKLFTALATLIACEEGICALDEKVDGYEHITVRELLCHASGLGSDADSPHARPLVRRVYSNYGYQVLGDHVAARAGFAFADYVHEAVVQPLGMEHARLDGAPGSGAVATVDDVARLAYELRRPTLIARETWCAMTTPQFPDLTGVLPGYGRHDPNPWGLGPEIRGHKQPHWTSPHNSPSTFGHFGRSGTFLWVDPEAGIGLVCLSDRPFGEWAVTAWPRLADAVLTELC